MKHLLKNQAADGPHVRLRKVSLVSLYNRHEPFAACAHVHDHVHDQVNQVVALKTSSEYSGDAAQW